MAKMCGLIGYVETVETEPGVWEEQITERKCSGDLVKNYARHDSSGGVNDNINIANQVDIIADPYAIEHFFAIRYIKFHMPKLGGTWKVTSAEVSSPRIKLTIGGVYNANES